MHSFSQALADTLVAALWADGAVEDSEIAYLRAKLGSLNIAQADVEAALAGARTPKALQDVDLAALTGDEKKRILEEAFAMITSDRKGGGAERDFLKKLVEALGFDAAEGKAITIAAAKAAKARQKP